MKNDLWMSLAGIAVDILFVFRLAAQKDRNEKPDTNDDDNSLLMLLKNNFGIVGTRLWRILL